MWGRFLAPASEVSGAGAPGTTGPQASHCLSIPVLTSNARSRPQPRSQPPQGCRQRLATAEMFPRGKAEVWAALGPEATREAYSLAVST